MMNLDDASIILVKFKKAFWARFLNDILIHTKKIIEQIYLLGLLCAMHLEGIHLSISMITCLQLIWDLFEVGSYKFLPGADVRQRLVKRLEGFELLLLVSSGGSGESHHLGAALEAVEHLKLGGAHIHVHCMLEVGWCLLCLGGMRLPDWCRCLLLMGGML
jgi:hypothetical protein